MIEYFLPMKKRLGLCLLVLFLGARASADAYWESDYAAALLAFHDGDDDSALRLTESLAGMSPAIREVQELNALLLRRSGRWADAARAFVELYQANPQEGAYVYEAAACQIELGQFEEAKTNLQLAQRLSYLPEATRLLTAVIDYDEGRTAGAEKGFRELAKGEPGPVQGVALAYLGRIAHQRGRDEEAQRLWGESAGALVINPPADDDYEIRHLVDRLEADTKAKSWSARVGVYAGYDSNSLLVPTFYRPAFPDPSVVGLLAYDLAAVASVDDSWTVLGSYRGGLTLNASSVARGADFLTQLFGFSLSRNGKTSWGIKTEGEYALRNGIAGVSGFQTESLAVALAPFVRWALDRRSYAEVQLVGMPQKFFDDPLLPDSLRKTGYEMRLRGIYGPNRSELGWPPRLEASLYYQHTSGDEYRAVGADAALAFHWRFTSRAAIEPRLGGGIDRFGAREGTARNDGYWLLGADLTYAFADSWSFLLSAAEHYNASSVPSLYQYTRTIFYSGVEVTL